MIVAIEPRGPGRLTLLVLSQSSFHLVELLELAGSGSILSDLTAASFKRRCHHFTTPLSIAQCATSVTSDGGALVALSTKQKSTLYRLQPGDTIPTITELSAKVFFFSQETSLIKLLKIRNKGFK